MGKVWTLPVLCKKWVESACRVAVRDVIVTHHLSPAGSDLSLPPVTQCCGARQNFILQLRHLDPSLPGHCVPGKGGI